jgi:acetoin utilization protein AcuB
MLVRSRMTPDVLTVTSSTSLGEALRITRENKIRHLPVVDDGRLRGVVSDRDLRLAAPPVWASGTDYDDLRATFETKTVGDVMTAHTIISTTRDTPIEDAARLLYEHKIGCVPVMDGEKLVGILTETDVMRAFVELFSVDEDERRIEILLPNRAGELARVVRAIGVDLKVNITGVVMPPSDGPNDAAAIFHLQTRDAGPIIEHLRKLGYRVGSPAIDLEPAAAHVREHLAVRHWGGDGF